jgi:class 3 adenylate cyclase
MRCAACGTENPDDKRFCRNCGGSLSATCPACGAQLKAEDRFCGDCGTPVEAVTGSGTSPSAALSTAQPSQHAAAPSTELRHVSVLFCDLVGFTPFSEKRDPEEVREVLSGYFDLARAIVGRYGGVVQKFIGDAVMAVWGAPVAKEDDAERAVRAGLELVSAVAAYGSEHGTELQARVGIVTGGAATTETAEEGLVIGDRVNTAARIQSAAPPGCCYVDQATKRATAASVAYLDAGAHTLKGKAEPVFLHQALRVVAGVGGAFKSEGLEAPFVGRDRELRLVKDLFHASAQEHRAHLVSVTGIAGIGKSRLAWEFYKYMDGLSDLFSWHRGRCLSYGEGVAYWALAEMVRSRAGILEAEEPGSAATKLHVALEEHLRDPEERRWVEPRLSHLLGLEDRTARDKEDLFAAWRLFFERMSEVRPVVMSFEDMQWADSSLLDFVEYLLDWSAVPSVTSYGFVLVAVAMSSRNGLRSRRGRVRPVCPHRERTEDCSGSQVACICIYFGLGGDSAVRRCLRREPRRTSAGVVGVEGVVVRARRLLQEPCLAAGEGVLRAAERCECRRGPIAVARWKRW